MPETSIASLSAADKLCEAIERAIPLVPAEARGVVRSMVSPESIGLTAATLSMWAGSHVFGVGEVVDVILLCVGALAFGLSVFHGADAFYNFATTAVDAGSDAELDQAAKYFAEAVTVLGIATIGAIVLRGQGRAALARGRPKLYPKPNAGPPPPRGPMRIQRPAQLPNGQSGFTNVYGEISIAQNQSMTQQRLALYHELVHRFFAPRCGPFRQFRAELHFMAYSRSALLRCLEEALAEGYSQLRVHGLTKAFTALRFPLKDGYVTVSSIMAEGLAIGSITLGGTLFYVSISHKPLPMAQ